MAVRYNRLVSALALKCLATALLCVVVLADVRGQDEMRRSISQVPSTAPPYYRDVLPILRQHCVACHRAASLAPMSFETYEQTRRYAYLIRNVTQDRAMPPPFAIPLVGRVTNDPSLTPAQISTLTAWANSNAPAGDPGEAPAASHQSGPLSISKPDLIITMPQPVDIPASGNLQYLYQIVPTHFNESLWNHITES